MRIGGTFLHCVGAMVYVCLLQVTRLELMAQQSMTSPAEGHTASRLDELDGLWMALGIKGDDRAAQLRDITRAAGDVLVRAAAELSNRLGAAKAEVAEGRDHLALLCAALGEATNQWLPPSIVTDINTDMHTASDVNAMDAINGGDEDGGGGWLRKRELVVEAVLAACEKVGQRLARMRQLKGALMDALADMWMEPSALSGPLLGLATLSLPQIDEETGGLDICLNTAAVLSTNGIALDDGSLLKVCCCCRCLS